MSAYERRLALSDFTENADCLGLNAVDFKL